MAISRHKFTSDERRQIFRSTEGRCGICHDHIRPGFDWDADHIVPISRGGGDDLANLRPTHASCNRRRGQALRAQGVQALPRANVRAW